MNNLASNLPLENLRVIELSRILAGPWAGQTLGDLGADVIKVESPTGDDTRKWGPPFIQQDQDQDPTAAYFHATNRNKRSVTLDFKKSTDLKKLNKLIASADILIENFKVGSLNKYGLDYPTLAQKFPQLIYCSITGFGQDGPYANQPGYDFIIQGMSGLMSVTGTPEGEPQKTGVAITDIFSGLYAVIAIQAAVLHRQKTGKGQHIDISLLDTAVAVTANQAMNFLTTGQAPARMGNNHPNIAPYQVFSCADGHLIIAIGNDNQFQRFCDIIGRPDMGQAPKYATNALRVENRAEMTAELNTQTCQFTRAALLKACQNQNIPAGPINDMSEVFSDPHVQARELVQKVEGVSTIRLPIRFSDTKLPIRCASPQLGGDNETIFSHIDKNDTKGQA